MILRVVLLGVGLVLAGTLVLIFDVVTGTRDATFTAVLSALVLAGLGCLPLLVGSAARRP